ncbi:aminotransferase DegT [Flavobacterium columnare]|uniref:DegT/DnrJ/EryC1/StrS family aminotransferase n=1 Tax=Flavobacterium columnare TaxID=996 RepID=UPI0007F9A697|nr:DegT/DnrJ/EryC1/StrS family aminotransferase [Flavobacterium columnare]ANO48375.1 DegT/DnrJ/EryC1/StrS family aminotransferase [Flavobacterium columnare]PDS23260.1 aminotransferase DegT [Flavobacterium columnare] [Flavobacterium columnare NBRC 100251 = ATCC 23463]GEM58201.1 spore coat protein [Flavobacterium columnare NBRC 100251 = ATCC 23463]
MVPVFKPFMPEGIMPELTEILYSGNLSYGKYGKLLEKELSKFIGNPYVLTVNSYNQAMLLALSVLGLRPGDQVIASPVSCLASNQPFVIKGIEVVWADVNPLTGTICPDDVKRKINSKTKAIFHNHFCGYIGHVNAINALAKQYSLWIVDDCIEAFGSEYNGVRAGNLGAHISVFSFQTVRIPNTVDGGALTFNSKELYDKAFLMRDYGIDRSKFRNALGEINPDCDISLEGYGATMNEINSYIGFKQMEIISGLIDRQVENAHNWDDYFKNSKGVMPLEINQNVNPNYWVYGVLAKNKEAFIKGMRSKGFYATGVHINNNIYSVFKNDINLKGVNEFIEKFVAIPSGWWFENKLK